MPAPCSIATRRLVLRRMTPDDAPAIVEAMNDWDIVNMLTRPPYPYAAEDAQEFLSACSRKPWCFGISQDGGALMGVVEIDEHLGYWLGRAHWGNGLMTESAAALLDAYMSDERPGFVVSGHLDDNLASARILRRLGFQETGRRDVHVNARGGTAPHVDMRIWNSAWPRKRRELLDARML